MNGFLSMSELLTDNTKQCRKRLLRSALLVLSISFIALISVQFAVVSIVSPLIVDLIIVGGIAEAALLLWSMQIPRCRLSVVQGVTAFLGLEFALFLLTAIAVPSYVLADYTWLVGLDTTPAPNANSDSIDLHSADLKTTTPHDFPSFRGADRSGIIKGVALSRDWDRRPPKQLWRHPVGLGWSSFAVVNNYCVTQEQHGEFETVVCYELRTGRPCWEHHDRASLWAVEGGHGPRATPTIHGGRVYAVGATGILNCLEGSTGHRLWSVNILEDNDVQNCLFGMAGSPLIVEPYVIVSPGGQGSSIVAYDQLTGKKIWANGSGQASYSSPQYADVCGEPQVLIFDGEGIDGHSLAGGTRRWRHPWVSNPAEKNNVCQPVVIDDDLTDESTRVFIASGYGQGCILLEVQRNGEQFSVRELWTNRNLKAKFSSVVTRDGYIYGLDERILVCLDLASGKRAWKQGRYGFGQLMLVGNLLLIQAESGDIALVDAASDGYREFDRIAALNGRTWNHPVLAGHFLLVRNDREAICYELPTEEF